MTDSICVHNVYGGISEDTAMRLPALRDLAEAGKPAPSEDSADAAADSDDTGGGRSGRFVHLLRFVPDPEKNCLRCVFLGAEDRYPAGPPGSLGLPTPLKGIVRLKFRTETACSKPSCRVVSAELDGRSPGDPNLVLKLEPDGIGGDPDDLFREAVIPQRIAFPVHPEYDGLSADDGDGEDGDGRWPPRPATGLRGAFLRP